MKEKAKTAAKVADLRGILSVLREKREAALRFTAAAAAAFMFGRAELLFETAPLGIAFVCAVKDGVPFAALGLVLRALVSGRTAAVTDCAGLIVALGFRYALSFVVAKERPGLFRVNDGVVPRTAAAVAGGFTVSAVRIIYNGFRYYDLLAAMFYLFCAGGAVAAYASCLDRENRDTQRYPAGVAALMFSAVLSLSGYGVFGVSVPVLASFVLTLLAGRRGGALYGIVAGFLCGAATDLSLCPMFGVTGFLCGLLSSFSAYIGILFSLVAGLFAGMQTGGFSVLTASLAEAAVSACLLLPAEYFGLTLRRGAGAARLRAASEFTRRASAAAAAGDAAERERQRMIRLSDAFGSLSAVMSDISAEERRPDKRAARRICSDVVSSFCAGCPCRISCFPDGVDALLPAVNAAVAGRPATVSDLPETVRGNCRHKDALAAKLGIRSADHLRRLAESDRAGAAASDCAFISSLLRSSADGAGKDAAADAANTSALAAIPLFRELFRGDVTVTGERMKYVTASGGDIGKIRQNAPELRRAAEKALGVRLCAPEVTYEDGAAVFRAERSPELEAEAASSGAAKENSMINGDSAFQTQCGDRQYFAVCDGMGSGRDAAVSSRLAGVTLGRLFYADVRGADALDSLNRLMRQRRAECFSTVDVLELDMFDGSAAFYKCGACPSFISRDGKIYRIASHTPPVGIMEKLSAEKIELKLKAGDVVLMMSDGVTGQTADADWVGSLFGELEGASPAAVCGAVLDAAEKRHGKRDDMTVMAVKIAAARDVSSGVI